MNSILYVAFACWFGGGECFVEQDSSFTVDEPKVVEEVVQELVEVELDDNYVDLNVAFTSQAPAKDWSEPWQNACEETSVLMVDYFYNRIDSVDVETASDDILHFMAIKNYAFGESLDEDIDLVLELINEIDLKWTGKVVYEPTIDMLLEELSNSRPVIAPVYARELGNPYYLGIGPDYHMLVLVGYDLGSREFIVNDPGTQFGEGLRFSFDVMMEAIHDLDSKNYDQGEKVVLFTDIK